jgi:hypothetical protein
MAATPVHERSSERGVVFIQVAISILVLVGFLTFVLDYGVMWFSRAQAQNAADAAALAGAVGRAFDDLNDPPGPVSPPGPVVMNAALAAGRASELWTAPPPPSAVLIDWQCPALYAGGRCVRARVYADGTLGSTPPRQVFGMVLNIPASSQGVRATATAIVQIANTTNCMRPFAIPDRWTEVAMPSDQFNHWEKMGNSYIELAPHDTYVLGSGYSVPADIGVQQTLKVGNPNSDSDPIVDGWYLPVRLPNGEGDYNSGGADFSNAIKHCIGEPVHIGDYLPLENGVMNGPSSQGVETDDDSLINQDPMAIFNTTTKLVEDSCAPSMCTPPAPFSPRIVPVTVFDIEDFNYRRASGDWSVCPGGSGNRCIKVANILGFFVDHMTGSDVVGYLMTLPGEFTTGWPSTGNTNGFLKRIMLVQ